MSKKWRPGKVLEAEAVKLQRRVADAIGSTKARVPHRSTQGALGGSLKAAARSRDILLTGKSHAGVAWSKLGQKFLWFLRGTKKGGKRRQKPRRIKLTIKRDDLASVVEADAFRHFSEREKKDGPAK